MIERGTMVISLVDKGDKIRAGEVYKVVGAARNANGSIHSLSLSDKDRHMQLRAGEYQEVDVTYLWDKYKQLTHQLEGIVPEKAPEGAVSSEDFEKLKKDVTQIKRDITNIKKKLD